MKTISIFSVLIILFLSACQTQEERAQQDTPTSGTLKVFSDYGLKELLDNQAYTFKQIYPLANIQLTYTSESEAVNALFKDSCRTIALNRFLSKEEEEQFKNANIFLSSALIGKTAIALIVNKESADTTITMENLISLLAGDTSNSIYKSIVFENEQSSSINYCKDSLINGKPLGKNCYASKNVNELLNLIITNKKSIAVIDYARISDSDDPIAQDIKSKCKIIGIAPKGSNTAYFPDQSNIQTDAYPLTRRMYMIRRGQDFSLAAGFITFVAGPKGQVMMLKTGYAPWRQPERVISIDMKPVN